MYEYLPCFVIAATLQPANAQPPQHSGDGCVGAGELREPAHTPPQLHANVTDVTALASCMTGVTALASCTKVTGVPALAVKLAVAQHQGICTATLPQNW